MGEKQKITSSDVQEIPDIFESQEDDTPLTIEIYKKPDGGWSFKINGQESLYRSSKKAGLLRTIKGIMEGRPAGSVALKAMSATALAQGQDGDTPSENPYHWMELPTVGERLKAFMSRGKLGKK